MLLNDDKNLLKGSERSEQQNLSSEQKQAQNGNNFITLGKITEEEKIKIIQTGFHIQNQGKI